MNASNYKLQALDIHKSYGSNAVLKGVSINACPGDAKFTHS